MDKAEKEKLIKTLAQRYSLELLLLFGSRVSGRVHSGSDFDIAYLSRLNLSLLEEAELMTELAPFFGSDNLDLLNLKKASPLVFYAVFNDAKVIYEKKPSIFASLRAYAFKRYVEAKPLYEQKLARLQNKNLSR